MIFNVTNNSEESRYYQDYVPKYITNVQPGPQQLQAQQQQQKLPSQSGQLVQSQQPQQQLQATGVINGLATTGSAVQPQQQQAQPLQATQPAGPSVIQ